MNPNDKFKEYFTEKLWEMIPELYRSEDETIATGEFENRFQKILVHGEQSSGPLRELIELFAEQATVLRRSSDRLWEDHFIEYCCSWAVPYIGDLLGTRLVSVLNHRARRVDTAKTIYYRRRKGTLCVLEELISDITGWEGTVVENFRKLGRTRHGLDQPPLELAGPISSTPPGGTADLRSPHMGDLLHTPFDEFHYTADMRRHQGIYGRYAITKIAFHIYRLKVYKIENATPDKKNGIYSFDPSGREIPLFRPRNRLQDDFYLFDSKTRKFKDWENWRLANEWELPDKIRCRLLEKVLEKEYRYGDFLSRSLWMNVSDNLHPKSICAGRIENKNKIPSTKEILIDPEKGMIATKDNATEIESVSYYYGFSGAIGAGSYDRRHSISEYSNCVLFKDAASHLINSGGGELQAPALDQAVEIVIQDCATYSPIDNFDNIENLIIRSKNKQRPFLQARSNWELNTNEKKNSLLIIDGLWIGTLPTVPLQHHDIVLKGNYEKVIISNSTIDPGNFDSSGNCTHPFIKLIIDGYVENLIIKDSIVGPITISGNGMIERLSISGSIVQHSNYALDLDTTKVELKAVTVLGNIRVHRLTATDTIITDKIKVTDIQNGCFRFSAAIKNVLPKPYRSVEIRHNKRIFASTQFGTPEYAKLLDTTSGEIYRGAEDHLEMGGFNKLLNPIKLESLKKKVDEYIPFGLIPIYIFEN